jgi:hypothetical protein
MFLLLCVGERYFDLPDVPPGNDYEYDGELSDVARKLKPDQQALEALEVAKKAVQAHFAQLDAILQVKLTETSHLNHLAKVCVLDSAELEVVGSVRNKTCVGTADLDVLVPFNLRGHPVEIDGQSPKGPYEIQNPYGNVELKKANIRSLLGWFNESMKSFLRPQLHSQNGSFTLKNTVKDLDTVIKPQSESPKNVVYPLEFTFGGVTIDVDIVPIFRGTFGKFCMIYTDSTLQLAQHTIAASHIDAVSEALKGDVIDMIKFLKHLLKLDPLRPVVAGHTLKLPSCTMESAVMLSAQREGTRWWANNRSFLVRFRDSLNIIHHRLIHKRALASPSNPFGNVLEWFMEDGAAHDELKRWLEFYLRLNDTELLSLAKCTSNEVRQYVFNSQLDRPLVIVLMLCRFKLQSALKLLPRLGAVPLTAGTVAAAHRPPVGGT